MKIGVPTEYQEQVNIFKLIDLYANKYPELRFLTGSLSGVRLTVGTAVKCQKAGCLVKGIPDLFLPVRRGKYSGLFIELKRRKGGSIQPEQKEWREFLISQGYDHHFCRGSAEAWDIIMKYLKQHR